MQQESEGVHLMRTKLVLSLGLCLALLTGCPPSEHQTQHPSASPSATFSASPLPSRSARPSAASARPGVQAQAFSGLFMSGDGLQLFRACGSREDLWIEDPEGILSKRHAQLKGIIDLEPVYTEIEAEPIALKSGEGFASGFSKGLRIRKVKVLRTWSADGSCFPVEFTASGHRPEWTLQVLTKNQVYFKAVEGEFPVVESLSWQAPVLEGHQWKYSFRHRSAEAEILEAIFRKEPCQDGARQFDFKARITFRGITYEGCARAARP